VTACHITTFYYVAFAYLMLRRYKDAGATLSSVLFFLARTKQYNARLDQVRPPQTHTRTQTQTHTDTDRERERERKRESHEPAAVRPPTPD
jgi:cytochrome c-type biogenesis protein CcmH/NrfG